MTCEFPNFLIRREYITSLLTLQDTSSIQNINKGMCIFTSRLPCHPTMSNCTHPRCIVQIDQALNHPLPTTGLPTSGSRRIKHVKFGESRNRHRRSAKLYNISSCYSRMLSGSHLVLARGSRRLPPKSGDAVIRRRRPDDLSSIACYLLYGDAHDAADPHF